MPSGPSALSSTSRRDLASSTPRVTRGGSAMQSRGRHLTSSLIALALLAAPAAAAAQAAKYPTAPVVTPPAVVRPGQLAVATHPALPPLPYPPPPPTPP